MFKYRIAICDDETYYIEEIISLLKAYQNESENIIEISTFTSGDELLKAKESTVFHIVILDVEMNGKSGIDIARDIRKEDEKVILIFATSHSKYAINAFDVEAFGYLVKPVSYVKLKKLLSKATIAIDYQKGKEKARKRYLEITAKYEQVCVEHCKITYIEKRRNVCIIHTCDDEYTCYETLAQLHSKLDTYQFVFTHQGYIVNFDKINEVTKTSVILEQYLEIPLSRKYQKDMRERFMEKIYLVEE